MTHRSFFASLLLSTSLLFSSACSTTPPPAPAPPAAARVQPSEDTIDRAELRAALAARRAASIERFLAYREARVYPVNTFQPGLAHVWVDELGNLCAAATLISGDWGRDATTAVSFEDNFIALAGVKDGPLLDWMLTSGLTQHEIVAIQEPGFMGRGGGIEPDETLRLYQVYISVERQLTTMSDASLDDATDALMERPDLAKRFLDGEIPGAGRYLELV